jgi:hypothetical protein
VDGLILPRNRVTFLSNDLLNTEQSSKMPENDEFAWPIMQARELHYHSLLSYGPLST